MSLWHLLLCFYFYTPGNLSKQPRAYNIGYIRFCLVRLVYISINCSHLIPVGRTIPMSPALSGNLFNLLCLCMCCTLWSLTGHENLSHSVTFYIANGSSVFVYNQNLDHISLVHLSKIQRRSFKIQPSNWKCNVCTCVSVRASVRVCVYSCVGVVECLWKFPRNKLGSFVYHEDLQGLLFTPGCGLVAA